MAIMKGGTYVKGARKKLVKETRNTHWSPRLLVTVKETLSWTG